MSTEMDRLEVPQAALQALARADRSMVMALTGFRLDDEDHVRAIAAPVAAALLRRLAGDVREQYSELLDITNNPSDVACGWALGAQWILLRLDLTAKGLDGDAP